MRRGAAVQLFDDETVVALQSAIRRQAGLAVDPVEMTHQVRLQIGGGSKAVIGPGELLTRGRPDQERRDDHDQLGFAPREVAAAEQGAEHGQVLEARHAVDVLLGRVRDQARQCQRSAGRQLQGRLGLARLDARDLRVGDDDAVGGIDLADLRLDLQADAAFRQDDRREREADAVFLEGDRQGTEAVDRGEREFAAGPGALDAECPGRESVMEL